MAPRKTKTTKGAPAAGSWCVRSGARELALERLTESGLTPEDAVALGLDALDAPATGRLHPTYQARPSLRIPYFNPAAPTEGLRPFPKWPAFYRLRYLGPTPPGFTDLATKPRRYAQEPDSGVCAYFPRGLQDWPSIIADASVPLLATEGEFKAGKACREGYPTIGLGGVYNWRSARLGVPFLPELEAVNWVRREVYLVFDSDFRTNEMVCEALHRLGEELASRGAIPLVAFLPDLAEGTKTGLDDFLVARPAEDLDRVLGSAQPLTLARALWSINDEVVYARDPGMIVVRSTGQRMAPAAFTGHAYAARVYFEQGLSSDGTLKLKQTPAAPAWLKWPLRAEVARMTYEPGSPSLVERPDGTAEWNVWPGWGVEPKAGDVAPFLALVAHLFKGAEPGVMEWFLRWCACPLQRPGIKMFSAAVVHGLRTGTGKSLVGVTLGRIYGKNFSEIKQSDLEGDFNEWAENKQFVLGDEVTGSNRRKDADTLKKLITQTTNTINAKYIPSYSVPDRVNYYFTSNHPDAFFMEDDDRRFFVHEVTCGPLAEKFYSNYQRWLADGGPAALFHYLLALDLGDFNPAAAAMKTMARERMIMDGKSDLGAWCVRLRNDPDGVLRLGDVDLPGDLFTAGELIDLYDPQRRTGTTEMGLAREMRRAGIPMAIEGAPVETSSGRLDRVFVMRDHAKWAKSTRAKIEEYLAKVAAGVAPRGRKY